ncbi:MAG TPA: polyamine aminopropyltransferase [Thermoanaerobaculia bacterium]|nr:polyamine aminopropyltransferase [Thermoanaerobaculia bacterium]
MIADRRVFTEEQTPHISFSLAVRRWLCSQKSAYQQIEVVETEDLGRLLALDGRVMVTERDERFYHEMLVHPPLLTHPDPRSVLVIGAGDGGTLREVLRHPTVERVLWVEIDPEVVAVSREHLPGICEGVFTDPRVSLHIAAGEAFVRDLENEIDVVIVDSTDATGPAHALFEAPFFRDCQRALRPGGIYETQSGSPFYYPEEARATERNLREVFAHVRRYHGAVPSFNSGMCAFLTASEEPLDVSRDDLARRLADRGLDLAYYSPEVHLASGVIPAALL